MTNGTLPHPPRAAEVRASAPSRAPRHTPIATRTRTCTGSAVSGATSAAVYAAVRTGEAAVFLEVVADALRFTVSLGPTQARQIARALSGAADVATNSGSKFTRGTA